MRLDSLTLPFDDSSDAVAHGLPPTIFGSQVLRPAIGILLYAVAALLGWFVHPRIAVGIFIFIVGYYAWTSQGIPTGDEKSAVF